MNKSQRGRVAHYSGHVAEGQVAAEYAQRGFRLAAQRWRGKGGEIDLVFEGESEVVFVEVKRARNFDAAISRITPRQITRICSAAEEYLGLLPRGQLTPMRVDAALVNAHGEISILENAIAP